DTKKGLTLYIRTKKNPDLYPIYAAYCYLVAREQHRQLFSNGGLIIRDPKLYLEYSIKVAKAIQEYETTHKTTWMPEEYAKKHHSDLFNNDPHTIILQRCSSVVLNNIDNSNNCYGFRHSLYYQQFLQFSINSFRKAEILQHLEKGSFEFESLFKSNK
ncbi:MAG: hypothetical protein LLG04_18785, partial [Parachlamydia sp.]|nr:hypothetical protein [Parachlamydia sp.]